MALEAAVGLLVEHGVTALTHQNLAEASGLSRATLYRQWPTMVDLLLALLDTFRMPEFVAIPGGVREVIEANLDIQLEHFSDRRYLAIYLAVQSVARESRVKERLFELNVERVGSVRHALRETHRLEWAQVVDLFALLNGPALQLASFAGRGISPEAREATIVAVLQYLEDKAIEKAAARF
ncbi:MAG: helix-turn-helix transcriptional regulator [Propionibacteriaceae bacterium]|nr:helix-turn-helix transcriptional regulator [Propionibacteriaceae bacterium]